MNERAAAKKHGTHHLASFAAATEFSSFAKTMILWVALTIGALFFWLRTADLLPDAAREALPETYSTTWQVIELSADWSSPPSLLTTP